MDIEDFLSGLQNLTYPGVNMLDEVPDAAPTGAQLPAGYLDMPTIIGRTSTTLINSAIRPRQFRCALAVLYTTAESNVHSKQIRDELVTLGKGIANTLDAADIGFRLSYEIVVDRKLSVAGKPFHGIAAVITGER